MPPDADRTAEALSAAVRRAAVAERLLVGCDFDGTLAPIVARPDQARPQPGATQALASLAALPRTWVAVISGRAIADLPALLGPVPGVVLIGGHGSEWDDEPPVPAPEKLRLLQDVVATARGIAASAPGAAIEVKRLSVAIHVRGAQRGDAARVLALVARGPALREGVSVIHGKEVVELSVAEQDKGTALAALRARCDPCVSVYLGDDVTDEAAFAALRPGDLGFKIGPGESVAALRLADPAHAVRVLACLARLRAHQQGR